MTFECNEVKEELPRDLLDALKGETVLFFKLNRKRKFNVKTHLDMCLLVLGVQLLAEQPILKEEKFG